MILAERNARVMAEANAAVAKPEAADAQADLSSSDALIAHLKLAIEKLRRELYGTRSERKARLLDQMELQLEDLEAARPRTNWRPRMRRPGRRRCSRSSASGRPASRSPIICRASASSLPRRTAVPAAGRRSCRSWARTLIPGKTSPFGIQSA